MTLFSSQFEDSNQFYNVIQSFCICSICKGWHTQEIHIHTISEHVKRVYLFYVPVRERSPKVVFTCSEFMLATGYDIDFHGSQTRDLVLYIDRYKSEREAHCQTILLLATYINTRTFAIFISKRENRFYGGVFVAIVRRTKKKKGIKRIERHFKSVNYQPNDCRVLSYKRATATLFSVIIFLTRTPSGNFIRNSLCYFIRI